MEISVTAWHFRWLQRWGFVRGYPGRYVYGPKSLCTYFWALMFTLVTTALAVIVVVGVVALAVVGAISHPQTTLVVAGIVIVVVAVVALAGWQSEAIEKWIDALVERRINRSLTPKQPNLVWEFIKAKKRKVCPLIEYK